jgi:DNA-binding response OmpR family regulator
MAHQIVDFYPAVGRIIALSDDVSPTSFLLEREIIRIGRLVGVCDIVVNRRSVSRMHAEIERQGSHFVIRNRSRFETFVDGEPIAGDHILFNGQRIGLATAVPLLQFIDEAETVLDTAVAGRRLRYDADRLRFSLDGQPIVLTPQQFTLLHFLYQHPETVCTRTDCETAVWGANPIVEVSALHRLISDLRTAFRAVDPDADLIQTRRGVGYLLTLI